MRYFQLIATGVDTLPLLHALQKKEYLWNADPFRTTFERTPHGEVDDILVRFSDPELQKSGGTAAVMADGNSIWLPAAQELPQIRPIILDVMRRVEAYELNRVVISRLRPGKKILPHADNEGDYVNDPHRSRYHVCLQGFPGSLYRTGDETVNMLTGSVWWFNALVEHSVVNNSADDRIHMLIDVRTMP